MSEYYIICKRHMHKKDHAVLFWGPNHSGYRYNISEAGRYSEEQIKFIDANHYCDDMPVKREIVDLSATESVIDNRVLGLILKNTKVNRKKVGIKLTELHSGDTMWDSRAFCEPKLFLIRNKGIEKLINDVKNSTSYTNSPGKVTGNNIIRKLPKVEEIIADVVGSRNSMHDVAVTAGINECYRIISKKLQHYDISG